MPAPWPFTFQAIREYLASVGGTGLNQLTGDVTAGPGSGSQAATLAAPLKTKTLTFGFSGANLAPAQYVDLVVPWACTILAATCLGDVAGAVVFDVLTSAGFAVAPAASIVGAAPPTLSAALGSQDTTLTGWTVAVAAGSRMRASVTSTSGLSWAQLALTVLVS